MTQFLWPAYTLFVREVVRFLRQKNRVVGALGTPIVFWFLIGSGVGRSFQASGAAVDAAMPYLNYFFPGTIMLILLFTAIFSTISVIEDRREGFLQAVLVSPAPRSSVVLGKVLGGTALALLQGVIFLAMAPTIGIRMGVSETLYAVAMITVSSAGLVGLGMVIAWRLDSTQGFHAIMNLFLMPMWLLSGALFPMANAPGWLAAIMAMNPVTYGVAGLHLAMFGAFQSGFAILSSKAACFLVSLAFSLSMIGAAAFVTRSNGRSL